MALDSQSAANLILGEFQSGGAASLAATEAAAAPTNFCAIWKSARPILEFLSGIAMLIPGLGKTAGVVLAGLLKVGDQIAKDMNCS